MPAEPGDVAAVAAGPGTPAVPGPSPGRVRRQAVGLAAGPGLVLAAVLVAALIVPAGVVVAAAVGVVLGAALATALWWRAPAMVLAALGARPIDEGDWPRPFGLVDGLCATMGLSAPAMAVVDEPVADALTVGTTAASTTIVVTSGLLERLGPVELEGVLAHELSHVKHGDVALASVAAALALPLARVIDPGGLVHRLGGRGRELRTDQRAVAVTRYPPGLRAALSAMSLPVPGGPGPVPALVAAEGSAGGVPPGGGANGARTGGTGPGTGTSDSGLAGTPAGRATRWLWTVALGPAPEGEELIGNLDAAEVRMAALDEL